jgi:hypothetical protein
MPARIARAQASTLRTCQQDPCLREIKPNVVKMGRMSKSSKNLDRNWAAYWLESMSPVNKAAAPSQRNNPKNSHRIENGMPQ